MIDAERLLAEFADEVQAQPAQSVPRDTSTAEPTGMQSNGSAASRALKKGVHYTHEAMIDLIITCPGISQNDIAKHFGYTPSWISTLMASDAFQAQLAKRRAEIIDPLLTASVEEKFKGITSRAADLMMQRLSLPDDKISDTFLLRTFDLSSRAAGYGARVDPPQPKTAEVHLHLESLGQNLDNLLVRRKAATEYTDAEVIQQPPG